MYEKYHNRLTSTMCQQSMGYQCRKLSIQCQHWPEVETTTKHKKITTQDKMCLGLTSLGWLHGQDCSCNFPKESLRCTQDLFQLQCPRPGTNCIHRAGKIEYYKINTAGIYAFYIGINDYDELFT